MWPATAETGTPLLGKISPDLGVCVCVYVCVCCVCTCIWVHDVCTHTSELVYMQSYHTSSQPSALLLVETHSQRPGCPAARWGSLVTAVVHRPAG